MSSGIFSVTAIALVLALGACDKGDANKGDGDKGGDKAGDTKASSAKGEVPVEEDFEDEAFQEINEDNLDAKVAELENELK